jgi:predicted dehydrogenase
MAALKAGKHVLCEKPLARTSVAAREILRVQQTAKGFLMPAMCMRFWPGWSWLKEVVEKQTYGKVLVARFRRLSEMPGWSKQGTYTGSTDLGGALFDLHIHDTDFVQFLFGKPQSVFSTGVTGPGGTINQVVTQYLILVVPQFMPRAVGCWRKVLTWPIRCIANGPRWILT